MSQETAQAPDLDQWMEAAAEGSAITTEQLDMMAKEYQEKYEEYEKLKAEATQLGKDAEVLEGKLIEALNQAGKTKYYVDNIGTFYFINKMTVPTPKTVQDKKKLFDYLLKQHGETFLLDKQSINHQTLQSLYKAEFEDHVAACEKAGKPEEAANFTIPGLSEPTTMQSLGLRKDKQNGKK